MMRTRMRIPLGKSRGFRRFASIAPVRQAQGRLCRTKLVNPGSHTRSKGQRMGRVGTLNGHSASPKN